MERDRPNDARPEDIPFADILLTYYNDHARRRPCPERVAFCIDHLLRLAPDIPAAGFTPQRQDDYIAARRREGVAASTIRREMTVARAALNRAVRYGQITHAPKIGMLPKPPPKERWLTPEEARRMFAGFGPRQRHLEIFARIALETCCRPGAALELTWDQVDLDAGIIDLNPSGREQTAKHRAKVRVSAELIEVLRAERTRATARHVIAWKGARVERISKGWRRCMRAMGLSAT